MGEAHNHGLNGYGKTKRVETKRPQAPAKGVGPGSLGRRFGQGEAEASQLVRQRVRRILAFRSFGASHEEQLDLEQEIMTQLWQFTQRPAVDLGERFWGLVEVVTARRSIDWLRARRQYSEIDPEIADGRISPLDVAIRREQENRAQSVLERLPKGCRDLIVLSVREQKSYGEIATLVNKTEGALRVQMHRCLKKARALFEETQSITAEPKASGSK